MAVPIIVHGDLAGGPILATHQQWMSVGGKRVVVVPDNVTPHGVSPHDSAVMAQGSPWLHIMGLPVCRMGDLASCSHPAVPSIIEFAIA